MSYRDEVLADSPLSYWRLGEPSGTVAADEKATAAGTYTGGFTLGQTGGPLIDPDKAVLLNGTTGWVQVVSPSWTPGDTFTIELWVKRTATGGAVDQRLWDRLSGPQIFINLTSANDKWSIGWQGSGTPIAESTSTLDTNWHHLVWTKSGATNKMLQDGVDVTGAVTNATVSGESGDVAFGRHRSAATNFANASLDEYAVYSTALSQTRAQAHFNAIYSLMAPPRPSAPPRPVGFGRPGKGIFHPFTPQRAGLPNSDVSVNAENASLTVLASDATATVAPNAGNAALTVAASNATPSVAPNAGNAAITVVGEPATTQVATTGGRADIAVAASQPTPSVAPNAGNAAITVSANQPTGVNTSPSIGVATLTVVASNPTPSVSVNAGVATLTLVANNPAVSLAPTSGVATITGAANGASDAIAPNAGVALINVVAEDPTVTTGGSATNASAENAALTVSANGPAGSVAPNAGSAAVTVAASGPAPSVAVSPGLATITLSANDPTVLTSGGAISANAGVALVSLSANDAGIQAGGGGAGAHIGRSVPIRKRKPVSVVARAGVATIAVDALGPSIDTNDDDFALLLLAS